MKKSKDTSPIVHQRDKVKDSLNIREFKWTDKQKEFLKIALDKETRLMFINGPAGSSKSLLSVFASLKLLSDKRVSDILYIRSAVESSDSKLGFLPGDVDDKLHYYGVPFIEKLDELLPRNEVDRLQKDERLIVYPVNYARGMSWNAKAVIFDEAQNSTQKEIVTIMTRIGKFSKLFICADPAQTDLTNGKVGGFSRLAAHLNDEESKSQGIRYFELDEEDIMRDELVKFLVKKLKTMPPPAH